MSDNAWTCALLITLLVVVGSCTAADRWADVRRTELEAAHPKAPGADCIFLCNRGLQ